MPQKEQIHTGHRERLKNRFRQEGLDHFQEVNVLELLLFYCIPKQDTNPLAHRLIDEFGSLKNVLEAEPEELRRVKGMGEHSTLFLSLLRQLSRYYSVQCAQPGRMLATLDACGEYLRQYFLGRKNETVFLLSLDAKCAEISCRMVGEGGVNSANVPIRRVVEMAIREHAQSVVLAHNHPNGLAIPSREDIQTTHRVAKALAAVDIQLADHVVVAGDDFISMVQSGFFRPGMDG